MSTNKCREALADAARSLETIATRAGSDDLLTHWGDVRAYAANRALVARAALAQPAPSVDVPEFPHPGSPEASAMMDSMLAE